MQSSWLVLTVIFCILKELQCSAGVHFHSFLKLSWLYPHMSWWLSLIIFSWASVLGLPLFNLQEAHTLFLYFLWTILTDNSSVSEHETQSPEAMFRSELSTFSLDNSEFKDIWSLVLFKLPAAVQSSGSMVALVGLEGGLTSSHPCCSKMVPVPSINSCLARWNCRRNTQGQ